jgi:hypothetical protein
MRSLDSETIRVWERVSYEGSFVDDDSSLGEEDILRGRFGHGGGVEECRITQTNPQTKPQTNPFESTIPLYES